MLSHRELGELLDRAKAGEQAAFDQLYRATAPIQLSQIRRYLGEEEGAEDLLQEAYLVLWKNLDKLRQTEGLVAYLNRVTYNLCMNRRRSKSKERARLRSLEELPPYQERAESVSALEDWEAQELLREAMGWLGEEELEAVSLRHFQGKTVRQTAEAMHLSERTVQRLLKSAAQKMKKGVLPAFLPLPLALGGRRTRPQTGHSRWLLPAAAVGAGVLVAAGGAALPPPFSAALSPEGPAREKVVSVEGKTTLTRARLIAPDGAALPLERGEDGVYRAAVRENGRYRLEVSGPLATAAREVAVADVDREGPRLISVRREGGLVKLTFAEENGLAEARCTGEDGAVYLPARSEGDTLSFALPEGVYRAEIADGLGNCSAGEVTVAP